MLSPSPPVRCSIRCWIPQSRSCTHAICHYNYIVHSAITDQPRPQAEGQKPFRYNQFVCAFPWWALVPISRCVWVWLCLGFGFLFIMLICLDTGLSWFVYLLACLLIIPLYPLNPYKPCAIDHIIIPSCPLYPYHLVGFTHGHTISLQLLVVWSWVIPKYSTNIPWNHHNVGSTIGYRPFVIPLGSYHGLYHWGITYTTVHAFGPLLIPLVVPFVVPFVVPISAITLPHWFPWTAHLLPGRWGLWHAVALGAVPGRQLRRTKPGHRAEHVDQQQIFLGTEPVQESMGLIVVVNYHDSWIVSVVGRWRVVNEWWIIMVENNW